MTAPRLMFLVTEDWYFWSHRLPMARAARDAGFVVGVACRVTDHGERILAEGFALHPLTWQRRATGLLQNWRAVAEIAGVLRAFRPDILHNVALKPVVLGSLAARLAGVRGVVNLLAGLGFVFTARSWAARLLRPPVALALGLLLRGRGRWLVVQNVDDLEMLVRSGMAVRKRARLIRGSGVDLDHYAAMPEPGGLPVTVGFVGRMLDEKGVRTLVEAHRLIIRANGHAALRTILAGTPDPEYADSISEAELRAWAELPGLEWWGHVPDVREVWRHAHIGVLPSWREGLPKSLLEAAACGRPMIASDVPGCREVVREEVNGYLFEVENAPQLADRIEWLAADMGKMRSWGAASRHMAETEFGAAAVGAATVQLYRDVLAEIGK